MSHCVISPERKRVKIAPQGLLSGFGPIFGAPKSGQEKGIGAFSHLCRSRQPAVRAATGGLRDFEIDADLGAPNMLWRYSLEKCPFTLCFQGF